MLLSIVRLGFCLQDNFYKMQSKLCCLVSKIHCLTNQNKPDNGQSHRVSHILSSESIDLWTSLGEHKVNRVDKKLKSSCMTPKCRIIKKSKNALSNLMRQKSLC